MLRIAICDNNKTICNDLKDKVTGAADKEHIPITVEIFFTGNGLLQALDEEQYDLIFLKISPPDINAFEISNNIRNKLQNHIVQLVYMSQEIIDGMPYFQMHPLDFLTGAITEKKIHSVIHICNILIQHFDNHFALRSNRKLRRITAKEVLYIESKGRHIHICTTTGTEVYYGKMSELWGILKSLHFLRIHNSIAVNCRYIETITQNHIYLTGNIKLPISQSKKTEVQEWLQFHKREHLNDN